MEAEVFVSDPLLNSKQIIKYLGLKHDGSAWRNVRRILMAEYGMRVIPGAGARILQSKFQEFLSDYYDKNA